MTRPQVFKFTTAGYPGHIVQEFEVVVDKLAYRLFIGEKDARAEAWVRPTWEQWASFREQIDAVGIWDWNDKYFLPIVDGEEWEIEIRYPDVHIASTGSNGYPGANPKDSVELKRSRRYIGLLQSIYSLMADFRFEIEWEDLEIDNEDAS